MPRPEPLTQFGENERQAAWVQAYLDAGCDGAKASEATGLYVGNTSRLLTLPAVQKAIAAGLEAAAKRAQLSVAGVLDEVRRLAFLDPRHMLDMRPTVGGCENPNYGNPLPFHEWPEELTRCVASIEFDTSPEGKRIVGKVKFWNKNDALTVLAKHFKILVDQRQITLEGEIVHKYEDMTPEQLHARVLDVRDSLVRRYGGQLIEAQAMGGEGDVDHPGQPEGGLAD